MDYKKLFETEIRTDLIKKRRSEGKKVLGMVCCHVPFELLHAAGISPIRLRATGKKDMGAADPYFVPQSCDFAKTIYQNLCDGVYELDGLVSSDGCDVPVQIASAWKRHLEGIGREEFIYDVSAPRVITDASQGYFKYELEDLRDALEEFSGNKITDEKLKHSIELYNEARRLVRQVYDLHLEDDPVITGEDTLKITLAATELPIEEYIELLKAFLEDAKNFEPQGKGRVRVMLVGSSLDDPSFIKLIEDCGCLVVCDLNSFGIRFLGEPMDYDENDPLGSLAKHYLGRASCPRMMDGSDRIHEYIIDTAAEFQVDGVIIERLKHCEKWQNEAFVIGDLLKSNNIQYIEVERQQPLVGPAQIELRVEAFKEMLETLKES
ncbi:MAG: 2-hydroxyacyl-CoA dehydratase [Clostridiales bacterium]|nr:2-hydroxyacyl-CoA dehydratase [Clostridiales bacterium]